MVEFPLRQGAFALIGFLVMLAAAHCDYRWLAWKRRGAGWRAGLLTVATLALLVAVLTPGIGRAALGAATRATRAIPGLGVGVQPSELAKVVLVIWVAALLTRPTTRHVPKQRFPVLRDQVLPDRPPRGDIRDFRTGFLPVLLSATLLIGLTGLEDFGTAALMGAVLVTLLFLASARWRHLTLLGLLGAAAAVGLILLKPHRIERIRTWLAEEPDPSGAGYQIYQAMLAIGSGGWWGRGLGAGVQKYGYLPQDNNDFIFAIICEELGVIGGFCVIAFFLLLLWRGWWIARHAQDRFGKLLAIGLTLTICLQAAFNVGVVTNSVPTKGISLPFVSAGGSGVVFMGLAAGLLAAIGRRPINTDSNSSRG